jgi:hypothetical protein
MQGADAHKALRPFAHYHLRRGCCAGRRDGLAGSGLGGLRPREPTGDESLSLPIEPRTEYGKAEPAPEPAQHYSTGLRDQLADQRRYAEQHALHQYIASNFPGALPHEAQWLMANPRHLSNPALVHAAAQIAAQRGIPRQDPQFLQFIGQLLDQHAAAQTQAAPPPMPLPMPPMPPVTHIDIEKTESPEGEPESAHMDAHFVSAPPSRGEAGHSIEPQLTPSQVRLTPEERELCQMNKIDEVRYAEGKLRLAKQKAAKIRD